MWTCTRVQKVLTVSVTNTAKVTCYKHGRLTFKMFHEIHKRQTTKTDLITDTELSLHTYQIYKPFPFVLCAVYCVSNISWTLKLHTYSCTVIEKYLHSALWPVGAIHRTVVQWHGFKPQSKQGEDFFSPPSTPPVSLSWVNTFADLSVAILPSCTQY